MGTLQHTGLQVTDVIRLAVEVPLIVLRDADIGRRPALLDAPVCQTGRDVSPDLQYKKCGEVIRWYKGTDCDRREQSRPPGGALHLPERAFSLSELQVSTSSGICVW